MTSSSRNDVALLDHEISEWKMIRLAMKKSYRVSKRTHDSFLSFMVKYTRRDSNP